jgi:outer membrane receptor for ferrienterochelin and colicins
LLGIAQAQNTFKAILKDSTTKERLIGATAAIKGTSNGASSNTNGEAYY